ncbi:MAG: hypothetical protein ACI4SF_06510 [Oscillospiraceae bacterium]
MISKETLINTFLPFFKMSMSFSKRMTLKTANSCISENGETNASL